MPQVFQVLKCYKCFVFQVHQTKKTNKFECKMCGEKQSIKRHYGMGTGMECRSRVQQLNGIRGVIDMKSSVQSESEDENKHEEEISCDMKTLVTYGAEQSKWSVFVNEQEELGVDPDEDIKETMCLEEGAILDSPQRTKRKYVKTEINSSNKLKRKFNEISNNKSHSNKEFHNIRKIQEFNLEVNCESLLNGVQKCDNISVSNEPLKNNNVSPNIQPLQGQNALKMLNKMGSKWAQFVSMEGESENEGLLSNQEHEKYLMNQKYLFSLCDDNDLDSVLNI